MALSVICVQLAGHGLGIGNALHWAGQFDLVPANLVFGRHDLPQDQPVLIDGPDIGHADRRRTNRSPPRNSEMNWAAGPCRPPWPPLPGLDHDMGADDGHRDVGEHTQYGSNGPNPVPRGALRPTVFAANPQVP